jgi:Uma2 family endonuclease
MSTAPRLKTPMTTEEYLSGPPDEFKHELIYGELVMSPRPTEEHQDLAHHLGEVLRRRTKHLGLGKVSYDIDMVLDAPKNLVYAPDVLFVSREHESRRKHGRVYGPADLCVEVLSPSDRPRISGRKFADYEHYGVTWYWLVNPNAPSLEENELVNGAYLCRSEIHDDQWFEPRLFPGLQLRLPPLLTGDLKAAVKGKDKKLV